MSIERTSPKSFLGAQIPNTKVLSAKTDEIINKVNDISAEDGVLLAASIDTISTASVLEFDAPIVEHHTGSAINATATATAAEVATGLITSTSGAATAITLPSAAALLAVLGAARGTSFDLAVDNSVGSNTVTVTASATITAATAVITGGATLTVASGAVGLFRIYFVSATAAKIYRIG